MGPHRLRGRGSLTLPQGPGQGETGQMNTINEPKATSPQIEDGYTPIANEIVEALAKTNLSAYEIRILWVIWRKTYGWHKKEDQISVTQFQKATELHRRHVQRTIKRLIERNIIASKGYNRITSYQFQKDYTKWKDIASKGYPAPKEATDRSLKRLIQKHLTKALKNGRSKKEPDPRVKTFFDFWGEAVSRGNRKPLCLHLGDKEGRLVKDLLKVHSLETLETMVQAFFRDEEAKRRGFDIGIFKAMINRLGSRKAMDPLERFEREHRERGQE